MYSNIQIKYMYFLIRCGAKTWAHNTLPTQLRRINSSNKLWLAVPFNGENEWIVHIYLYFYPRSFF